ARSSVDVILDLFETYGRFGSACSAGPTKHTTAAAVEGTRHGMLHLVDRVRFGIEDSRSVGVVVTDDDIEVSVAVEIGNGRCAGEPAFGSSHNFNWPVRRGRQRWLSLTGPGQKRDRRAAPVMDQQVHCPVFVEIGRRTTHRRHRGAVEQLTGFEYEWLIT